MLPTELRSRNGQILLVVLILFFTASSYMLWSSVAHLVSSPFQSLTGDLLSLGTMVPLGFGLIGFLASFILINLLFDTIWIHLGTYGLGSLPLLVLPINVLMGFVFSLVMLLILLITDRTTQYELKLHTRINLNHIYGHKLSILTTSLSFMIAFLFLVSSQDQITTANITIPTSLFDQALKVSQPIVTDQLIKQQDALYDAILTELNKQLPFLENINKTDKLSLLRGQVTEPVRDVLTDQGLNETQIDTLVQQLQQTPQLSLPEEVPANITDVTNSLTTELMASLKKEVEKTLNSFLDANIQYVPWIVSAIVFVTFSSFGIFIKLLSVLLAALILRFFLLLKIVNKQTISQPVEVYRIHVTTEKETTR